MDYNAQIKRAARLRELAATIRSKQNDREAIAEGFELVAEAMEPCIDCGAVEIRAELAPEDNPATGAAE